MHTVPRRSFSSIPEASVITEAAFAALSRTVLLPPGDLAALAGVPTVGFPQPDCVPKDAGTGNGDMAIPVQNLHNRQLVVLVVVALFEAWGVIKFDRCNV